MQAQVAAFDDAPAPAALTKFMKSFVRMGITVLIYLDDTLGGD